MIKSNLTQAQAQKFAEGYNKNVETWNSGTSDGGKSPFRASTWADLGYTYARSEIVRRQLAKEGLFKLDRISTEEANKLWLKG